MVALPLPDAPALHLVERPMPALYIVPHADYRPIQDRLETYLRSLPPASEWVQLILFAPDDFLSKRGDAAACNQDRTLGKQIQKYRDLLHALMPLSDQELTIAQRLSALCLGDAIKCHREYLVCCQSEAGTTFYLLYRDCQLVAKIYMRSNLYSYRRYVFALAARTLAARGWRALNTDVKHGYGGDYTLTHTRRNVANLVRVA